MSNRTAIMMLILPFVAALANADTVDPNLLVWYKFDEAAGYIANDSSGYDNHGFVDGHESGWQPNGGFYGGCRIFNDDTRIDLLPEVLDPIDDGITVSLWLKGAFVEDYDNWVFDAGFGGENAPHRMQVLLDGYTEQILWRAGNGSNDVLACDWNDIPTPCCWWPGDWHWFIFVKNEVEDRISIYVDCAQVASANDVDDTLINLRGAPFCIGRVLWHNYDLIGLMDDFRIYDYAISEGDIAMGCHFLDSLALAWNPEPPDGDVNVPPDSNLTWIPGDYALQHRVFFGKTWEDANNMTDPCAIKSLGDELYEPGPLDLDTTYFWRIDEVNGPNTWKGCVWSFATADFIVIDDMESYDYGDNLIWYTWYCKQAMPYGQRSGATLELSTSPIHFGEQAMKYNYETDDSVYFDQDLAYAEASLPLNGTDGSQDWTAVELRLLTILFYGQADNDTNNTEQMYVGIEDADGLYAEIRFGDYRGEDMNDLKVHQWQRWDIALEDFSDPNYAAVPTDVNLAGIVRLYIGFGNKLDPIPAGSGIVYFDDIRLYQPICKSEYGPVGDLTGDCFVDGLDLRLMADDWLRHDVNFPDLGIEVQEPCDANLVGHWRFDEGDGNTAADSSDYNNPGTLEGEYSWVAGRTGPYAVEFSGGRGLVPDTNDLKPDTNQVSVTVWIYIREQMSAARVVVKGKNDHESYALEVDYVDTFIFQFRDGNHADHTRYDVNGIVWPDEWIHLAGTYDGSTIACYANGQLEDAKHINNPYGLARCPIEDPGFAIGNRADDMMRPFVGRIDDVRVYDYGLSQAEVAWLATEGAGYVPLDSPANIYDQESPGHKIVNFKDFALLAQHWLQQKLWPQQGLWPAE